VTTSPQPDLTLRLVNTGVDAAAPALHPRNTRRHANAISTENLAAAQLSTTDARWAIAAATAAAIEGGTAAIIRPESRRRLLSLATSLGLRPCDANLLIAIVQDAARSGAGPLGPDVADRLTLIREPTHDPEANRAALTNLVTAIALAALLLISLILWIL
jgi:hypothetical protein